MLEGDLRAVTCDIDHLEGAIKLFDPDTTPEAVRRYTTRHRSLSVQTVKGLDQHHMRFDDIAVLNAPNELSEPTPCQM